MFKFVTATVFLATPLVALALGLTAGVFPALIAAIVLPVLALGFLVARLALTPRGREEASNLQTRSDGLRESLR